ncbi:hypothetical protein LOD99_12815 [Oopsacas minuta]|uniref:Uncharacterized protein n=1 Tax=Oopsacas minuta TaxID=111878 RepID=A0AAV7JD21_9METZ|nr:hypothetical protein LOD99_12815 [Oopsacas minuta]
MSDYTKRLRPRVSTGIKRSLSSSFISRRLVPKVSKINKKKQVRKRAIQTNIPNTMNEIEIAPIITEPIAAFDISIPVDKSADKPKKKITRKKSKSVVHKLLKEAGIEDPEAVCVCLKAGISAGCINFEIPNPLDQIILQSQCFLCENEIVVKVRDVLYQGATGGNYWGGYDNDVICPKKGCQGTYVVSHMCTFRPNLDYGKYYNHCDICPGFGKCIGDYRESHCLSCGGHYFAGSMSQFKCSNCYSDSEDEGNDAGMFGAFFTDQPLSKKIPVFSYIYKQSETLRFDVLSDNPELSMSPAFQNIINDESSSSEID